MTTFHIITLFPDSFSYLNQSILKRAAQKKKITVKIHNLRDFTTDKHKTADDRSYGGGPGMVLRAEPIIKAVQIIKKNKKSVKIIALSADGKIFTNARARVLAKNYAHIILIAGHYEGIDERAIRILKAEKISVGPYILTGGELPAMIIIDSVTRQIPGVLGAGKSLEETRVSSPEVYTRPESITNKKEKYQVPKVLLSGDHKKIEEWRRERRM